MGGTVSRPGGVENPFPVGPALSKDLDLLTTVAVRLLSSSDIYDITNLENPGACGAYAVFMKKNIEKRLLSFVADLSGGESIEILYQNPGKLIPTAKRREICKQLAETIVTLVATIVALLASIQVKSDSRSAAARAAIPSQKGGADIASITEWFLANGYIRAAPTVREADTTITYELYSAELQRYGNAPKFILKLDRRMTSRRTFNGTLTASGGRDFPPGSGAPPFPAGALEVQVMLPIRIPGTPTEESVLPFRLSDRSNLPWMAGALYKSVFFTASPNPADPSAISPFDVWSDTFRLTQGLKGLYEGRENRANINRAAEVFSQYSRTQDQRTFLQALSPLLSLWTEYRPEAAGIVAAPPVQIYPGMIPPPTYGSTYPPPVVARPTVPYRPAATPLLTGTTTTTTVAPAAGAVYDIARPSTSVILDTLRNYKQLIPDESSPAAVRAFTLAGKVNPDRTVNTDICNDPYWRLGGLHLIYPWATLQFLSVNNWEKLGTSGGTGVFHDTWLAFLRDLRSLYNDTPGRPKITGAADSQILRGQTFTNMDELPICASTRSPRVRFIKIQDGLLALQGRYERHVRRVWELLNSLIVVIVDPETREQTVRLHPSVYSSGSREYVERQAATARALLSEFYLGVEHDYLNTVGSLVAI